MAHIVNNSKWMTVGEWLNPPLSHTIIDEKLVVAAVKGSDFWQKTAYGFKRDSGHALLSPFPQNSSIEVSFIVNYSELYDQAGVFIRMNELNWLKAGVEYSDGSPQLGAVMTVHGQSDWSCSRQPECQGNQVTIRASRTGDSVTIRGKVGGGDFRFMRLVPFDEAAQLNAGLYCCAPEREGLAVTFTRVEWGKADASLHC